MIARIATLGLVCTAVFPGHVLAQTDVIAIRTEVAATQDSSPVSEVRIPAKSVVDIEITQAITSNTNVMGDLFTLKLAAPLILDGQTVLPAGLTGRGEVTHAARRGAGGQAGELIINARYLECGDLRIPLGHFAYNANGQSNVGAAFATAQVIPFGQFLVSGKDAIIPAGVSGTARIKSEIILPAGAIERCTLKPD